MKKKIKLFPSLTKDLKESTGLQITDPTFSYIIENEEYLLKSDNLENFYGILYSVKLIDERNRWSIEKNGLKISFKILTKNVMDLFSENGIANIDSVIGVAVQILSKKSNKREVIQLCELNRLSSNISEKVSFNIEKERYFESCTLRIILYTKQKDYISSNQIDEINGRIIGNLEEIYVSFTGEGSTFPIIEINEPNMPLWSIYKNWENPLEDEFHKENFSIRINRSHPDFQLLTNNGNVILNSFTKEIISSAIFTFIMEVKDTANGDWENILNGEELEPGTIAFVVNYFKTTHQWEFSTPVKLNQSVRDFFNQEGEK